MEIRIPKSGEIYKHFKGNLYEIVIIARDSETLEEKVVYKEVDSDAAYVRSLPMFVSPVDKEKYPNVTQEMRFQFVEMKKVSNLETVAETVVTDKPKMPDENLIMGYFDQEFVDEKIDYLIKVKDNITENFVQVVAQSLDFVENEGSLSERYDAIVKYLRTVAKFESGRLR